MLSKYFCMRPNSLLHSNACDYLRCELKSVVNLNKAATSSVTTSMDAADKFKTCHYHFQVSNIAIQIYLAFHQMQAIFLLVKLNFVDDMLTAKYAKITSLNKLYIHSYLYGQESLHSYHNQFQNIANYHFHQTTMMLCT